MNRLFLKKNQHSGGFNQILYHLRKNRYVNLWASLLHRGKVLQAPDLRNRKYQEYRKRKARRDLNMFHQVEGARGCQSCQRGPKLVKVCYRNRQRRYQSHHRQAAKGKANWMLHHNSKRTPITSFQFKIRNQWIDKLLIMLEILQTNCESAGSLNSAGGRAYLIYNIMS